MPRIHRDEFITSSFALHFLITRVIFLIIETVVSEHLRYVTGIRITRSLRRCPVYI